MSSGQLPPLCQRDASTGMYGSRRCRFQRKMRLAAVLGRLRRSSDPEVVSAENGVEMITRLSSLADGGLGDGTENFVVLSPEEEFDAALKFWDTQFPRRALHRLILPRGGGPYRWTRKNPPNTVERSLALLGQTVDAGRVLDIASEISQYPASRESQRLVGRGQAGILAVYAAVFMPNVGEVVVIDPPTSHRDGPHFLNVDRVLDLPTALGLLAPDVKLTLINAKDPAFDKTDRKSVV